MGLKSDAMEVGQRQKEVWEKCCVEALILYWFRESENWAGAWAREDPHTLPQAVCDGSCCPRTGLLIVHVVLLSSYIQEKRFQIVVE